MEKLFCGVFFNPQYNFSSQNLSIEHNFFKWDGKEAKILHLLFHRIWKNYLSNWILNPCYIFYWTFYSSKYDHTVQANCIWPFKTKSAILNSVTTYVLLINHNILRAGACAIDFPTESVLALNKKVNLNLNF